MRTPAPLQYSLLDVARAFSVAAHCAVNQKRKYSGEDYFHHPEEVLQLLLTYDDPTLEMQVAALLHDVVEDTSVRLPQIRRIFGVAVTNLVNDLTEVSTPADGNRAARKKLDLQHLINAKREAMKIKCADLISNSRSIVDRDAKFAAVYLIEKLDMLKGMKFKIGNTVIWQEAFDVCLSGLRKIYPDPKEQYDLLWKAGFQTIRFEDYLNALEDLK